MKCPGCSAQLESVQAGKVTVEVCNDGCAGVWFDWNEIKNFDEQHEIEAAPLLALKRKTGVQRNKPPLECPICENEFLVRQFFDPNSEVEIDLCWKCSGVWLDCGELQTIRGQFKTEEERAKAGDAFVSQVMEQHLQALNKATEEKVQKLNEENASRLSSLFHSFRKLFDPLDDGLT